MAKKKPYRFVLYLAARLVAGMVYILPRRVALALARAMGFFSYLIVWRHRIRTVENLRRAYGREKSEAEIKQIARKVFENMAETAVELLQMPKLNFEKVRRIVDTGNAFEIYQKLLAEGKGIISITAHIGNWELLAGVFGLAGFSGGVLARRIYYAPYNDWIVDARLAIKVPTIYRDESAKRIFELLGRNQIIGLLPDQDIEGLKGEFVPFFGEPAYTPIAPVKIALATGAPIAVNFLIRQPGDRYKLVMGEIIRPVVQTTREEAVRQYTAVWMKAIEDMIRAYPEQWAWMHNRWKTQPAEAASESLEARKVAS
ncbi:MAG: lysophospholipid acyltransferase family protein [Candidatus Omnitrophica bacterium]|nr:lysophospholipid acyltransferase family protein [Candidatus Omnitrophota bacterium]